jgi:hypothetical protein
MLREFIFAHCFGAGWSFGQNQVANLGCRVPNSDLDVLRQFQAELGHDGARLDHRTSAIRGGLIPGGWQT